MAEREGFEPSARLATHNGFRDRPIQPLLHLSVRSYFSRHTYFMAGWLLCVSYAMITTVKHP